MKRLTCLSFCCFLISFLYAQSNHSKRSRSASLDCPEIISVEFSSNGLGGGSTLCNHPYDFDDYVNTFKATINNHALSTLEYMILDMNTGAMVYSGTISDFADHNQYPLPASLTPGMYNFEGRIVGSCGTTDWFEGEMLYSNCGHVNAMPVAVLPAQYKSREYGKVFY